MCLLKDFYITNIAGQVFKSPRRTTASMGKESMQLWLFDG